MIKIHTQYIYVFWSWIEIYRSLVFHILQFIQTTGYILFENASYWTWLLYSRQSTGHWTKKEFNNNILYHLRIYMKMNGSFYNCGQFEIILLFFTWIVCVIFFFNVITSTVCRCHWMINSQICECVHADLYGQKLLHLHTSSSIGSISIVYLTFLTFLLHKPRRSFFYFRWMNS